MTIYVDLSIIKRVQMDQFSMSNKQVNNNIIFKIKFNQILLKKLLITKEVVMEIQIAEINFNIYKIK